MRRWNGWGSEKNHFPLPTHGASFLYERIGAGHVLTDASLDKVIATVPDSRLPSHPLIHTDPEIRVRHARGQSLPDWLAMRSGEFGVFPDGVALPTSSGEVAELLRWAELHNVLVIPYGGGTSVAGHITPPVSERPVLTLSLRKMKQLLHFDPESQLATFGAGVNGPELEAQLAQHGYCLGHYPQSWELSTLGGWVASRSSGQQSLRYGRIEQLFAGGRVVTPKGELVIPTFPASSAGPDLREMLLGSEGRFGVLTEITVRATPLPERESFHVAFAPTWESGIRLVRAIAQAKIPLSMVRLSNAVETTTQLQLAGKPTLVAALEKWLSLRGLGQEKCMLTFGVTGSKAACAFQLKEARKLLKKHAAIYTGTALGKRWQESRFRSPYFRHGLWELGYAVDTFETACDWSKVNSLSQLMENAIKDAAVSTPVHVFTHLSHIYGQGSSIYTTYIYPCASTYKGTLNQWKRFKTAASDAVIEGGGTISHQHGVGRDHAPWLAKEKGQLAVETLNHLAQHFDPRQQLNTGCLVNNKDE